MVKVYEAHVAAVVEALNAAGCDYILAGSAAAEVWGDQEVVMSVTVAPAPGQHEAVQAVVQSLAGHHGRIEVCPPCAKESYATLAPRARTVAIEPGLHAPVAVLEDLVRAMHTRDRAEDRWAIPRLEVLLSRRTQAGWEY